MLYTHPSGHRITCWILESRIVVLLLPFLALHGSRINYTSQTLRLDTVGKLFAWGALHQIRPTSTSPPSRFTARIQNWWTAHLSCLAPNPLT